MRNSRKVHDDTRIWKGAATGAIGGLVASWTMNQFQAGWSKAAAKLKLKTEQAQPQPQLQSDSDDATMKMAERITETLLHRQLSKAEKNKLGPVVHYAFGSLVGAAYGVLAELTPVARAGHGALFGTAVFAGADEIAVPALHLSGPPKQYPLSSHAEALAAHCVYGLTTETVRELVRRAL